MTTTQPELRTLRAATLPRWSLAALAGGALAVTAGLFAITPLQGAADFVVVGGLLVVAAIVGGSWFVEGRRRAVDRAWATLTIVALALALLPLGFTVGYTVARGLKRFDVNFLTHSMAGVGPLQANGGVYHAIVGTLEQVLLASVISVPLGLLVAIYIAEYGRGVFANAVRFLVDVMTGIPSIVAGLFVLAFWVLALHKGFSGFAGAIALSILELPIIVRSCEEMIKLVPGALREASYALGIPKWRTISRVVLPTAATGITTGVMLAIARVMGETAPVLLVVGGSLYINNNPFQGQQDSLGLYVFRNAGSSSQFDVDRAWAAALTLILLTLVLYVAARLLTRRNALVGR